MRKSVKYISLLICIDPVDIYTLYKTVNILDIQVSGSLDNI